MACQGRRSVESLTALDKSILNMLQTGLPLTRRPFGEIARRLAVEEQVVLDRLRHLKERGLIRRIGAFFDAGALGYVSTLIAAEVCPQHMAAVAGRISGYSGVTHNYERYNEDQSNRFTLWFTLLSKSLDEQKKTICEIGQMPEVERLISLPAEKKYKVNVKFLL